MATATEAVGAPDLETRPHRLTGPGVLARAIVAGILVTVLLVLPNAVNDVWANRISLAAIYGIIGLSINVLTGHAGQISLGHQAFVGIGAFMSAYVVTQLESSFYIGLPAAGAMGGVLALILGLAALRITGLYLALITLAFGLMAETAIFNFRAFTGGGAGSEAPRPGLFESGPAFAYLSFMVLALVLFVDWRLTKSKAGRAIVSVRNDERVASTLGVNPTGYKLLAFVTSGIMAGLAGSLLAHRNEFAQAADYQLTIALVWILMAVVGGLESRAGVVIGSAFFALFPFIISEIFGEGFVKFPIVGDVLIIILTPLFGALLLILTLTLYPGGIGQQILPMRRWLSGGPFLEKKSRKAPGEEEETETVPAPAEKKPAGSKSKSKKTKARRPAKKAAPKKRSAKKRTGSKRKRS